MMKFSLSKKIMMGVCAAVLVAGVSVGSALAYFTTYAVAQGTRPIDLGYSYTIPEEEVVDMTKRLTVGNTGDYDVYVRVKAFAGGDIVLSSSDKNGKWTPGAEGYYYYSDIVPAKTSTPDVLEIKISAKDPQVGLKKTDFNVVVIQECTPVMIDKDGNPYADWTKVVEKNVDVQN